MKKTILFIALVAITITACAPSKPPEPKVDRVAIVEGQINTLANQLEQLRRAIDDNADSMDEIRDEILQQLREISADSAKIAVKFDNVEGDMSAIRERLDDTEYRINDLRQELNNQRVQRTGTEYTRPTGAPDRFYNTTGDQASGDADSSGQLGNANPLPGNEQEAYDMAYNDYLRGDYAMAINGFRDYLNRYENGTKIVDARFNLAEALFNQGDFESALEEYDTYILNYPNNPRTVNARYKKALSFLESNQTPSGVILLRQIISQYPDSNEARLASDKLRSLGLNP